MRSSDKVLLKVIFGNLINDGDKYRKNKEYELSIKCYEDAIVIGGLLHESIGIYYPKIVACYRLSGKPSLAVQSFKDLVAKDASCVTNHALLTTVGFAYTELNQWDLAEEYLARSLNANGGEFSTPMISLKERIDNYYGKNSSSRIRF